MEGPEASGGWEGQACMCGPREALDSLQGRRTGHGVPMKDKSTNPLSGGGGRTHPVLPLGRGGWGKRWRKAAVGAWPTGPPSFLKETGGAGKTPDRMGRVQFSPQLSAFLGGEGKGLFCGWRRVCRCKHGHVLRV